MIERIRYKACIICDSPEITPVLTARDNTVSKEDFEIWACAQCTLRFTQDIPSAAHIGPYYASDKYISHSDTKKGLVNTLYHWVRQQTLRAKQSWINTRTGLQKGRLLDIGAGTGIFLDHMKRKGWTVSGLEPDSGARIKAKELYDIELQPAENLFLLEPSFDVITLWHVLEHVHDLHGYLEKIKRLLAANGRLFIAVPNYTSFDAGIYGKYWAAYDVPRHLYHFSPASMKQLLSRHGFHLFDLLPMKADSFYVSLLSEQYKNGRIHYARAFWNGLQSNRHAARNKERSSSLVYIVGKEPIS